MVGSRCGWCVYIVCCSFFLCKSELKRLVRGTEGNGRDT